MCGVDGVAEAVGVAGDGLVTRLVPSDPALVMPVSRKARISGHQAETVLARRSSSDSPEAVHRS